VRCQAARARSRPRSATASPVRSCPRPLRRPRLHRLRAEIRRLPPRPATTISAACPLLAVLPTRSPTMAMPKSFYVRE
jgi:hypothetical protein